MMPRSLQWPGKRRSAAFSLLELLISIAVVVVIAALAFPAYQRVLLNAAAGTSVQRVRNLQLANSQYATEMNGWYVPFNVISGSDLWSGQWLRNRRFLSYLNITTFPHGDDHFPPQYLSPRSTIGRLPDGYGPVARSYAYNASLFGANHESKPIYQVKVSQIARPSALLAFADSLDFWVAIENAGDYRNREEFVQGGVAYRYGGRAAVAFFDGHAALLTPDQVRKNEPLWLNK